MQDFHIQREYGAAVEAHYGLKNVTNVSMPTNEHDEPLVMHISMLVSKDDIKGIAARFAGEVPAKTTAAQELDTLVKEFGNTPLLGPGRTRKDVMAEISAVMDRIIREAPPKKSMGEFTVKLDTSLVHDTIREMLEPGAMYLPPTLVRGMKSHDDMQYLALIDAGAIVAK